VDLSNFDYQLPEELIAQHPSPLRDQSRLMVVCRKSGNLRHEFFRDLPRILGEDDLVVLNNTRVFPARLYGKRPERQGWIEVLLVKRVEGLLWEALVKPGRRAPSGTRLVFQPGLLEAEVTAVNEMTRTLRFTCHRNFWDAVESFGRVPLPPYIRRPENEDAPEDRERYQTVVARVRGSVAAPTAGLHFTPRILEQINHREITLHVGYGTFKPIKASRVEDHQMEPEYYEIDEETASSIRRQQGRGRVIAVGTTVTRTLEHVHATRGSIVPGSGWTNLYIYPGFQFRVIDGLVTNFHLPKSTLLLLVSAFAGADLIRKAYSEAIERGYRFYSYGDAMLIL
jgi:S-adenosylmethionine:tRNA ribosyltransferase-isomerase